MKHIKRRIVWTVNSSLYLSPLFNIFLNFERILDKTFTVKVMMLIYYFLSLKTNPTY